MALVAVQAMLGTPARKRLLPVALSALPALVFAACFATTNEVQLLHSQLPALPEDCPVNVLAGSTALYPVEDLVLLTLAYAPGGRDAALNRLRQQTCYYGGDTLYDLREEARGNASTLISARIARRPPGSAPPAASNIAPLSSPLAFSGWTCAHDGSATEAPLACIRRCAWRARHGHRLCLRPAPCVVPRSAHP